MQAIELSSFAQLLLDAAKAIGAKVSEAPPQLTGSKFNSEVLSEMRPANRLNSDLPREIIAVQLDDIPVLIGTLTGAAVRSVTEPQLRRYRNQALIARSWLGYEAPNLQLFLVGPNGALVDGKWRQIAAEIEADDRTCRKLVWLFDGSPSIREARTFLERTFVARPWPTEEHRAALDVVADYSLPPGWEEAIDDPSLDYGALVERLIQLEQGSTS